eukprot:CAMPEP_0174236336 /NCGR_PEP_ID=MMETSP0417-20130205/5493_1 /TAXON_ID=242541 /ORGANISM="Mayorella sp, Strain BSH-02190019" /LENGTH=374 /DNA_ID=CAMNT_0015314955 /DNA_START=163 /DNA_END=1287 /DNA_ORIENTATION=-
MSFPQPWSLRTGFHGILMNSEQYSTRSTRFTLPVRLAELAQKGRESLQNEQFAEAEKTLENVLLLLKDDISSDLENVKKEKTRLQIEVAFARQSQGKFGEAESLYAEALSMMAQGDDALSTAVFLINYAECLSNTDKLEMAIEIAQKALPLAEKAWGKGSEFHSGLVSNVAIYLSQAERYDEALGFCETAVESLTIALGPVHSITQSAVSNMVSVLTALGREEEANQLRDKYNNPMDTMELPGVDQDDSAAQEHADRIVKQLEKESPRRSLDPMGVLENAMLANDQLNLFIERWKKAGLPLDDSVAAALRSEVGRVDELLDSGKTNLPDLVQELASEVPEMVNEEEDGYSRSKQRKMLKHKRQYKKNPRPPLPF